MYDCEGVLLRKMKLLRINDLALTRDGAIMVTVNQEKLIKVQRLADARDVRPWTPFRDYCPSFSGLVVCRDILWQVCLCGRLSTVTVVIL